MERRQPILDPWVNKFIALAAAVLRDAEDATYAKDAGLAPALHPDLASAAQQSPDYIDPRTKA